MLVPQKQDVVRFLFSGVAGADVIPKVFPEPVVGEKRFNVAGLTVRHDKKRVVRGQSRKHLGNFRVQLAAVCEKQLIFHRTGFHHQSQRLVIRQIGKEQGGKLLVGSSHICLHIRFGDGAVYLRMARQNGWPDLRGNVGRVPKRTVQIE